MAGKQPMFNIPMSIIVAALAMIVLHIIRTVLPSEERLTMLLALAFVPARYAGETPGLPGGDWSQFTSFITYMFVHSDATHLIINMVWMLAFGSAVAKRIGDLRFILFSIACGIAGVLVHLFLHFGELSRLSALLPLFRGRWPALFASCSVRAGTVFRCPGISSRFRSPEIGKTLTNPQVFNVYGGVDRA